MHLLHCGCTQLNCSLSHLGERDGEREETGGRAGEEMEGQRVEGKGKKRGRSETERRNGGRE